MGIAGVSYDASLGIIEIAFQYTSTIIPMVLGGFEFWFLLLMNFFMSAMQHLNIMHPEKYHFDLPWGLTGVTGGLMTFFVCFYNQHVFGRYNKLYNLTKKMCENCLEIVSILRVQVADKQNQRKIAKLVITSCFMFFFERTENDTDGKVSTREFKQLKGLGLLGDTEIEHLQKHCERYLDSAMPSFLTLQWAMQLMRASTPNPEERDDMLCGFYARVYRVRKCQAEVCQIMDLPMPFQYFHIMNLMLILNLVLWAYSLGCQNSFFAPLIYMFVQMMFQGIRELSTALSDPFGDDEVDFPVTDWMITVYARMYAVLEDPYDIRLFDLDRVKPLLDPKEVKSRQMINVYCDVNEDEDAPPDCNGDWCGTLFGQSQTEDKSQGAYQRVSQDDEDPLLNKKKARIEVSEEEHSEEEVSEVESE